MNIYDPDEDYLDRHHGEGPDDWYGANDLEQPDVRLVTR